jgi:hypothetical protein
LRKDKLRPQARYPMRIKIERSKNRVGRNSRTPLLQILLIDSVRKLQDWIAAEKNSLKIDNYFEGQGTFWLLQTRNFRPPRISYNCW